MNPQMPNYRQYAQAQGRTPQTARRPGECAASTVPPQWQLHAGSAHYQAHLHHHSMMQLQQQVQNQPISLRPIGPQLQAMSGNSQLHRGGDAFNPYLQHSYTVQARQNIYLQLPGMQQPNQAAAQHQQQVYQQQMAQRNAHLEHQLAQRRARKPVDRNMPEGIEDMVIGDGVQQYKELREVEKKLDYAMMRKRLDIQDTVNRNVKRQKTMRIWISNTTENQAWQRGALDENAFDFNSGPDATYRVKIEGKVVDEPEDEDDGEDSDGEEERDPESRPKSASARAPKKFSQYFKSISVEFDRAKQNPTGNIDPAFQIDWKKTPQSSDFDCLQFTRKGDENMNITVSFVRDEQLERYRLSKALADTLDMEEADRAEVVMGIWEYVKAMGLQEDEERRLVRCDERLRSIFGTESFLFPQVADRIMPHLHPLSPIRLNYTIRVDQAYADDPKPTIYDIKLTTDDPLRSRILSLSSNPNTLATLRQIAQLDDQLAVLIQAIQHHKAKHTFYRNFSRDPVAFLRKWYASQQHDLSVLLGEVERGDVAGLEFAKGGRDGVWGSEVVNEAVRYRLAKAETAR